MWHVCTEEEPFKCDLLHVSLKCTLKCVCVGIPEPISLWFFAQRLLSLSLSLFSPPPVAMEISLIHSLLADSGKGGCSLTGLVLKITRWHLRPISQTACSRTYQFGDIEFYFVVGNLQLKSLKDCVIEDRPIV